VTAIPFLANFRNSIFGCFLLVCTGSVVAQTTRDLPASAYQLIAVKVTGSQRYKPEEVVAATGLQIGQTVHEDDFKAAARLLGDSGAFRDVAFSFNFSAKGTKVEFQVQDSPDFVPVQFENLVWFSDGDLAAKLHARVPLFDGELPVHGDLASQLSLSLQALLIEEKVEGRADYMRVSAEGGPTQAFDFSVTGPHIIIHDALFPDADPAMLPRLQTAARELKGKEYSRNAIRAESEKAFLRFYLQRGYLKATLGDPEAKVVTSDADETQVDVIFHPNPGPQYKLTELAISGNKVVPTDALRRLVHAQIGEPVNLIELENDLTALQRLYGAHGYMAVAFKTTREVDDKVLSVKYALAVSEGDVYTMGDLDIQGLDSHTTAQMQTDWALRGGDTYNSDYPRQFAAQAEKKLGEWNITIHESVNPKDKTVDVTLRFDPKS
jgi:outer membrane protein assembly factor BamA